MRTMTLEVILDMEPDDFHRREQDFLEDLSHLLGIAPSDVWIADIQSGCTVLILVVPDMAGTEYIGTDHDKARMREIKDFRSKYRQRHARPAGTVEAPYLATAKGIARSRFEPLRDKNQRTFTWLHLSDLHLRCGNNGAAFEQHIVTQKLLEQLPTLLRMQKIAPDVVFFTGDLAFSGERDEYEETSKFLEDQLLRLPRPPKLLFVPGNHDVTWSLISFDEDEKLRLQMQNKLAVSKHLMDSEAESDRETGFLRLKNYFEFSDACNRFGQPVRNHGYFWTTQFKHEHVSVGVAGLNSAWRCTRKDISSTFKTYPDLDLEHLMLGEHQLKTAADELENCDIKIALVHHPPMDSWFADFDKQLQRNYLTHFDFILRGHEHISDESVWSRVPNSYDSAILASGALYQADPWPKLFLAVVLKLDTRYQTIYKWRYDDMSQKWHAIVEAEAARPGMRTMMAERLRKRLGSLQ